MARMPVLFVGHGSPMNAIEDNEWSRGFSALASFVPAPLAILAVSAHWYVRGTFTTGDESPQTIHDFGGFPAPLYEVQYPAPGSPSLSRRVSALLGERASVSLEWGLDHGTWSVLRHLRPTADVPVVQLSLDVRLAPEEHVALGRALTPLREEGVLVMGSGNITHNLSDAFSRLDRGDLTTPGWATRFDRDVAVALQSHDVEFLAQAPETEAGRLSHPTPDHYLPLLYAAGAADARDPVRFPITGFDLGSLSMRAVQFG
jgi:4,5-DOPA dioxygenase extradiol